MMADRRQRDPVSPIRRLGLKMAVILAAVAVLLTLLPMFFANLRRVQALRQLGVGNPSAFSIDEMAWDRGWRELCEAQADGHSITSAQARYPDGQTLSVAALASIDAGDYATAREQFARLAADGSADAPDAPAYLAALQMDWLKAARLYTQPLTARHRRFWGTIFYLAAQQLMFAGQADAAGDLYREADKAYGVRGPYRGLALVDCLAERGRSLEAFDAYRRALVTMPTSEALAHFHHFSRLRLEGLRDWHDLDPTNEQVAAWSAAYNARILDPGTAGEILASRPSPQVPADLDLGRGRHLIGFDYRAEDVQTGPFMEVDLYLRWLEEDAERFARLRRIVLNRTPNGSFLWDQVPPGVRPFGWHNLVYSPDLEALSPDTSTPGGPWLCLDSRHIGAPFGLQGDVTPLEVPGRPYLQGGKVFLVGEGGLSLGRTWYGTQDPYAYSYVGGGRRQGPDGLAGSWAAPNGATGVAVWLLSPEEARSCFQDLYFFALPQP